MIFNHTAQNIGETSHLRSKTKQSTTLNNNKVHFQTLHVHACMGYVCNKKHSEGKSKMLEKAAAENDAVSNARVRVHYTNIYAMENFVYGQKGSGDAGTIHEAFVFTRLDLYTPALKTAFRRNATGVRITHQHCARGSKPFTPPCSLVWSEGHLRRDSRNFEEPGFVRCDKTKSWRHSSFFFFFFHPYNRFYVME